MQRNVDVERHILLLGRFTASDSIQRIGIIRTFFHCLFWTKCVWAPNSNEVWFLLLTSNTPMERQIPTENEKNMRE